jgi:hypothetical protein
MDFLNLFLYKPEGCHLFGITDHQDIAGHYRVVPGLALESREP